MLAVVVETRVVKEVVSIGDDVDIRVVVVTTTDVVVETCVVVERKVVVVLEVGFDVVLETGGSWPGLIAWGLPKTALGSQAALILLSLS